MSSTLSFKTCELLAHLRDRLPRAVIDYQRSGAMHKFQIDCAGLIYQVSFPEQVIDSTEGASIEADAPAGGRACPSGRRSPPHLGRNHGAQTG